MRRNNYRQAIQTILNGVFTNLIPGIRETLFSKAELAKELMKETFYSHSSAYRIIDYALKEEIIIFDGVFYRYNLR